MNPTESLADFITRAKFADLPPDLVEKSKWMIADGLAVTIAGGKEAGNKLTSFVRGAGAKGDCTVMGLGLKTNAPTAALANAVMSHVLDYDDLNQSMGGHPTGPVLAAVWALGETGGASGRDCLLAYILGVETETKLGRILLHRLYGSGWHPTSVLGVMGAAAASARLLKLNFSETVMALGMAGSFAGGLKQNFGSLTKSLHVGRAAENGVLAAMLAKDGWTAAKDILEGDFGFCNLFCGRGAYDLEPLARLLGNPWDLLDPGVQLKKFPCCGSIHPALEAVLGLRKKENLTAGDLKKLACFVSPDKKHILVHPRPESGLEAKFSAEYCLARAFGHGRISLDHFTDEQVADPLVRELLPRITMFPDPSVPKWGSRVDILTMDGRSLSRTCHRLPGIESLAELKAKFRDCVSPFLGPDLTQELFEMTRKMEDAVDLSDFMKILSTKTA